jgi:hypothetical protein
MYYFLKCENSICSLDAGEESSAECFWDIPVSAQSKFGHFAGASYCKDSEMESYPDSLFGTMLKPSTDCLGVERLMLSAPESHASESVQPGVAVASSTKTIIQRFSESFAKFSHPRFSWKTPHYLFTGDCQVFCGTWPQWGLMENGECWGLATPDFHTSEYAGGDCLPTPSGVNGGTNHTMGRLDEWGGSSNRFRGTRIGSLCLPEFEELLMGWPVTWTELMPLEMVRFQQWLDLHGKLSHD